MTSMPASRSALATTLAPRSCPSSPGLATTTRMRPCATVPLPLSPPVPTPAPLPGRTWEDTTRPPRTPPALPRRTTTAVPDPHVPPGPPRTPPPPPRRTTTAVPDPDERPLRPGRDPGGRIAYLPPKAAKARKLILRSQLGRGWIVAAALFGIVILGAGVLFLARQGRPGAPRGRVGAAA